MTSADAPQPLSWHLGVAVEAMSFFSLQGRDQALKVLGRTDPGGIFVPFEGSDFLQYLGRRGYPTSGRRSGTSLPFLTPSCERGI